MYIFAEKHIFFMTLWLLFNLFFSKFLKNYPYFMPSYLKEVYITSWETLLNILSWFCYILSSFVFLNLQVNFMILKFYRD